MGVAPTANMSSTIDGLIATTFFAGAVTLTARPRSSLERSTLAAAGGTTVAGPAGAAVALGAAELLSFDEELPELQATAIAATTTKDSKNRRFKASPPRKPP